MADFQFRTQTGRGQRAPQFPPSTPKGHDALDMPVCTSRMWSRMWVTHMHAVHARCTASNDCDLLMLTSSSSQFHYIVLVMAVHAEQVIDAGLTRRAA